MGIASYKSGSDPCTEEWSTEVASMSTQRVFFACSVISDKVYVGGGYSTRKILVKSNIPLSSAEVYDDRWEELSTMPNPTTQGLIALEYRITITFTFC